MKKPFACIAVLLTFAACSAKTGGPTPTVASVEPDLVCTAQLDVTLTISGSGFSPVVTGGLTDSPAVMMPQVFLVDPAEVAFELPPTNVSLGNQVGTELIAVVPAGLVAPRGPGELEAIYDLLVINPNGNEGRLSDAVTIVPPPELIAVNPNTGAQGWVVSVTLTGTGFRAGMSVTLDATPAVSCTNVVVSAPTSATCDFDLNGVAAGTYGVTVTNVAGCSDTLPGAFTVYEPNLFALTGIEPPFGCTCSDTTVTIFSDAGFVSTPQVEMRPHGESGPVIAFERVAFIDASTLTAIVPAGAAVGDYDVTVLNPPSDGAIGHLDKGFRVVANPIPTIEAIVPSRGDPGADTDVWIYGENFRDQVQVELIDFDGNTDATVGPISLDPSPSNAIELTLPTAGMSEGPYLVRVTNLDEDTYSTFSSFLVAAVGPSGNLHVFESQTALEVGRRMLAGVSARDDDGNQYLYALGGDTGATGSVLDSVEVTQLSKFGQLGDWQSIRNPLTSPRVGAAAVAVPIYDPAGSPFVPTKTFIYVLGGQDEAGAVLSSVERAVVLSTRDAPVVTDAAASATTGTLAAGTWYYKVSAVLAAGDPDNPDGETLTSDEAIVTLGADGSIDLEWNVVNVNGIDAASYRIYRTDAVDGASQTEHLIATTTATSFTDSGEAAGTELPLPAGSTGVWTSDAATLDTTRWGHAATVVTDSDGDRFLYVIGGKSDLTTGYLGSVIYAPIDDADGSIGTFVNTATNGLANPRAFFGLAVETPDNISGFTAGARLFAAGGVVAGAASDSLEFCDITAGGGNAAWVPYSGAGSMQVRAGVMTVITSEKFFALGGGNSATDTTISGISASGRDIPFDSAGDLDPPFQSTAEGLMGNRALGVVLTGSGFIYFVGGTSTGDDALATTERTF